MMHCNWLGIAAIAALGVPSKQASGPQFASPQFASPQRVAAESAPAGIGRRYPSPVLHDVNGDGRADLVLGDLYGAVTASLRLEGAGEPRFGPEEPLLASDGKELKFNNW